jgi:hypothetical protein
MKEQIQLIDKLINEDKNFRKAEQIAWELYKSNSQNFHIKKLLALVLLLQQNYILSEKYYIECVNEDPNDFDVNNNLASIYSNEEEFKLCEKFSINANNLNDRLPGPYLHLAELSIRTRQFEKAKKLLDEYINLFSGKENIIDPSLHDNLRIRNMYVDVLLSLNSKNKAIEFLNFVNTRSRKQKYFGENFGENLYKILDIDSNSITKEDLKELHSIVDKDYANDHLKFSNTVGANFALGRYYDSIKDKEKAEKFYDNGNSIIYKKQRFVPLHEQKNILNIFNIYKQLPPSKDKKKGEGIIFVIGLPRSGTTLLESIFATNENIESGGELLSMSRICGSIVENEFQKFEKNQLNEVIEHYGDVYLNRINFLRNEKKFFIDKLPFNYRYVGVISKILPGAKIINMKRNIWDICVSAYKQMYIKNVAYSSNFFYMSLGAANYLTCIQKWEKDPDILNFKSVNYEELVSNPNEISEDIFNFCDIDGGYNLKDRGNFLARTASQNQIKQDIHQKSVNKQEFQSHKKEFDQSFEQQLDFWQKKGFYTKN